MREATRERGGTFQCKEAGAEDGKLTDVRHCEVNNVKKPTPPSVWKAVKLSSTRQPFQSLKLSVSFLLHSVISIVGRGKLGYLIGETACEALQLTSAVPAVRQPCLAQKCSSASEFWVFRRAQSRSGTFLNHIKISCKGSGGYKGGGKSDLRRHLTSNNATSL